MALPNSIDAATPGGTDSPALGDDQLRALKTFIEDIFGVPDATSITAAAFSITAGGVVTASQAGFTATAAVFNTSISTPSIITASGALGITPAAGSNLNLTLSTTGDFAVNTNQFYVDTSTPSVGIGTATPGARTGMVGSVKFDLAHANAKADADAERQAGFFGSSDAANPLGLSLGFRSHPTAGSRYVTIDASEIGSAARTLYLQSISGGRTILASSAVGIGGTFSEAILPDTNLHVKGTGVTVNSLQWHIVAQDTAAFATNVGGGILFDGAYSAVAYTDYAAIKGGKENATSGNQLGYLTLYTNNGTVITERARIDSSGNVGIANTSPGALLDLGLAGTTLGVIRLEGSTSGYVALQPNAVAGSVTITFPATTGTVALTANNLSVFAATTSVQLAGVISDETGSGALVFGTSPAIASPTLSGTVAGTYILGGTPTLGATLDANGRTISGGLTILSPAAGTIGLVVNTAAAATVSAQQWQFNGAAFADFVATATTSLVQLGTRTLGNNVRGPQFTVGTNDSAGAEGPAAGTLVLTKSDATQNPVWVDSSASPGIVRIHTAAPTGSSGTPTVADTAGTVVGSQTSWWKLKQNIAPFVNYQKALAAIIETPLFSFDMNERHYDAGYVIYENDVGKWFSWNDDLEKQQIPALNERQILGYLAASIKALNRRIEAIE